MTNDAKSALRDLLSVTSLETITPVRVQAWQSAARELLPPPPAPKEKKAP
jgi:hypothetical protein